MFTNQPLSKIGVWTHKSFPFHSQDTYLSYIVLFCFAFVLANLGKSTVGCKQNAIK